MNNEHRQASLLARVGRLQAAMAAAREDPEFKQLDETSRTVGERVSQRIGAAESAGQRLSSRLRSSYSDVG